MAEVSYTGQIIREAPEIEAYKLGLLKSARDLSQEQLSIPAYQAAELSALQKDALTQGEAGIGSFAPFLQTGSEAIGQGMQLAQTGAQALTGATGQYDPMAAQAFMNPYQQAVTQQALGEMRRQADIARQGQAAQAVRAGAFGGTREGVQRAEFERGVQDIMSQRVMQDYAQNYAQAQQAAQQAFEAQQQRQLSGAGLFGQLGQGLSGMGVQQAAIGQAAQELGQRDVQMLANLGTMQQQAEQNRLEALRATGLQKAMTPYQQLSFLSDIYKGAPGTQMSLTSTSAPSTSPLLQAVGLGISGLAAATGAQKAGLFG
jgi:hypothetical protein